MAHMDLRPYVDSLRHELAVAADAGGNQARELAERLTAPLDSAARLVLLEVLSAAADEITRDLAPGSVEVRLRGRDPSFVVTAPPNDDSFGRACAIGSEGVGADWSAGSDPSGSGPASESSVSSDPEDGGTVRINLRLPDALKSRVEVAAGRQRLSVNAWLVRAAESALESGHDRQSRHRSSHGGERYTGWVR